MLHQVIKRVFLLPVYVYRLFISPMLGANKCRYQPTCSHYMIEAVEEWGIFRGFYMGIRRILRCHPWSTHQHYDPVPKKK